MKESEKISTLKKTIFNYIDFSLDWILKVCESEIEKQFLLIIFDNLIRDKFIFQPETSFGGKKHGYKDWRIIDFDFVYDIVEYIFNEPNFKTEYLNHGYKIVGADLIRPKGIKFKDENIYFNDIYTYYELIPQHNVSYKKNYRLDFAIIASHYENNQLKKTTKVAIECDGFEFHYTKEQQKKDNLR
ncbi:MAG: hypothetical protein WBP16_01030, partial [Ferruginibacter sp.]